MKVYSAAPEGNESADLEPARSFNLAVEQINEIAEALPTFTRADQPLLAHVDVFLTLARRFPDDAPNDMRSYDPRTPPELDVPKVRAAFDEWFDRCGKKIPAKYRADTKATADRLFDELERLGA